MWLCSLLALVCVLMNCTDYTSAFSVVPLPVRTRFGLQEKSTRPATITSTQEETISSVRDLVLKTMESLKDEANEYADSFGLSQSEAAIYAFFAAIRRANIPLGLRGEPFVLRHDEIVKSLGHDSGWRGFFTTQDLEKAVEDDFLDAARGSTNNRKGWQVTDVSNPRGDSFEEARMTFSDIKGALEKGTVIMNAAGAHIPKLAGPSLATTDAALLPCALNLYVTEKGKRTSAPPHTDKQDVAVIQTSGRKNWKVYSPPDSALKPAIDMFARGKNDDNLPLYSIESDFGCKLLIETTLNPGDLMFCPAAFPHTTSTVVDDDSPMEQDSPSIHLTLGIDHHIWELDYLSARRLALRRACVSDTALGQTQDGDNQYVGKANELPGDIQKDLFAELPLGLLDEDDKAAPFVEMAASELERISRVIDDDLASVADSSLWRETIERFRQEGIELLDIHRDMYLAAIEEGRAREAEDAMTAHLDMSTRRVMTPERMQRLSCFRVKRFYDRINDSKNSLKEWSFAGKSSADAASSGATLSAWAYELPVKVGDEVEADLGGAFFPAKVTRASRGTYDVVFFDGDKETGLDRSMIRLLSPPTQAVGQGVDTSKMTAKQKKRWKKQQEKESGSQNSHS